MVIGQYVGSVIIENKSTDVWKEKMVTGCVKSVSKRFREYEMKKDLYAVIDTASGVYDGPMPGVSDGHMVRSFSDMAVNAENPIGKHPEDYALIKVGTWNDGTGELEDVQNKTLITGLEAVANSRQVKQGELVEFDTKVGGTA